MDKTEMMTRMHQAARTYVALGTCPLCGLRLLRHASLEGFWQCSAYAPKEQREAALRDAPECVFMCYSPDDSAAP